MSALVSDLKERGMLNDTLVVWMGEFGRTPNINQRGAKPGRDHYPRAWTTLMIGGGIKGGQAVGKTDAEGAEVIDRPTSAQDFLATRLQGDRHRLHEGQQHADRPAHPHRGQGRRADQGTGRLKVGFPPTPTRSASEGEGSRPHSSLALRVGIVLSG